MKGVLLGVGALVAVVGGGSCEVGYSFRGPGYDPRRGVTSVPAGTMLVVAVTRGDVAHGAGSKFSRELSAVLDGMDRHQGLVGYSVRRQLLGSRVWTMSVWTDREALRRFVASPAHRSAIANGGIPREAVVSAYVEVPAEQIPLTWRRAKSILADRSREEGTQ